MVMGALRDKIKFIILITLLAFVGLIFFEWGMQGGSPGGGGNASVVGEVNGREIPYESYRRTRAAIAQNFEARTGRTADNADQDAIEDETWNSIVQDMLLQEKIDDYGIVLSDAEMVEILKSSPPEILRGHPDFTTEDGQFDYARYQSALNNPAYENLWIQVETYMRSAMPAEKVQTYIGLNARVTSAEVRERFEAQNTTVTARYVQSVPSSIVLEDDSVDDGALQKYYTENQVDFRVGEQAIVDVVRISKEPSAQDSSDARADLEDIRQGIIEGADFAEEAQSWSDDPSAERGGDLGFFGRGDMPAELENVAFALDPGQVSEVFESPFGYHVLKVDERKIEGETELVSARHILLRIEASNQSLRAASRQSDDFIEALENGEAFEAAAERLGLLVERTAPFERNGLIPGIGFLRAAQRFAFASEAGAVSMDPLENDAATFLVRVVERLPAGNRPLEEVRDRVEVLVRQERQSEQARQKLADAVASTDGSLDAIAGALGAVVEVTNSFTRESFVPGVGRKNAFVATAFALDTGQVSDIIDSERGYYVLEVSNRTPADESTFVTQRDGIRGQLLLEKRQNLLTAWLEQLMNEAEVIDYRNGAGVPWKPDAAAMTYGSGNA